MAFSTLIGAKVVRFESERVKGDRPAERWFAKNAE